MIQPRFAYGVKHVLVLLIQVCLLSYVASTELSGRHLHPELLSFSTTWQCLGPFRIGTREAIWGADPLELYGGFPSIVYNKNASFRSPLTINATVYWTNFNAKIENGGNIAEAHFELSHADVDWASLRKIYGWSALQYQTWSRGKLCNHATHPRKVLLYTEGILELDIDGVRIFGGDFFSFNRAPIVIILKPGETVVNIRFIRDVRAMGGSLPPTIDARIRVISIKSQLFIDRDHIVMPDLINGRLPSRYMSLPILNTYNDWVALQRCFPSSSDADALQSDEFPILIAPGQSRPLKLQMRENLQTESIEVLLCYTKGLNAGSALEPVDVKTVSVALQITARSISESHKFTFLHPSGAVSYAVLKPPTGTSPNTKRPLLVGLHGAGLEADSELVRHAFDNMPDLETFALFPTGMSPWSGDDWHIWGMADVLAAIDAIHEWSAQMRWNGTEVSTEKVLVSGHSNGGQGVWYFATHMPDRTLAAVAVSGYTSIENYVPYNMWHEADSLQNSIVSAARISFKHELLLENLAHLPVLQQHGSADDNVPPYHSRLMSSLRAEREAASDYIEVAGQGHWWDNVMTTPALQAFYHDRIAQHNSSFEDLDRFSLVSTGTDEMGSKFGCTVYQLESPDRLGRIEVSIIRNKELTWHVETTNIRAIQLNFTSIPLEVPNSITVDGCQKAFRIDELAGSRILVKFKDGEWAIENAVGRPSLQRVGAGRGHLDAIMRTKGPFQIVSCLQDLKLAIQISRNMLQYFGADSNILHCDQHSTIGQSPGNIITISMGIKPPGSQTSIHSYPISVEDDGVYFRSSCTTHRRISIQAGLGGVFLRPSHGEQLELMVWGYDIEGLEQASRLVPTLTGGGQPDFAFLGRKSKWQGHKGVLAMGFFDHSWNISKASYLP